MKKPTVYGEYVWNLVQAPTFANLSKALGGISRLAVALPEDDTLEVWSSCDSWFVGFVFEQGRFPRNLFQNRTYCINHVSSCWKLVGFEGD